MEISFEINKIFEGGLNKHLLLIVETIDNNIISLCFNKSNLPNKCFYLFLNDNKIFYYKRKRKDEKIQKNEIYTNEKSHIIFYLFNYLIPRRNRRSKNSF